MSTQSAEPPPPFYVLLSQSQLSVPSGAAAPPAALVHPIIQYHFADDPSLSLLPSSPGESVLVLDFDPASSTTPLVHSLSPNTAVTGVRVTDAPGAGATRDGETKRNEKMYIIETAVEGPVTDATAGGEVPPHAILAQFRHRNIVLRTALDFPVSSNGQN